MKKEIEQIINERYPEYDINADEETREDFWHELPDKEKYAINSIHLKTVGKPEHDYLICWEPGRFDTGVEVTDYNTMYEVDYEWWKFQRDVRWESLQEYRESLGKSPGSEEVEKAERYEDQHNEEFADGYKIHLTGDWYRMFDGETFLYSQVISAKWFLFYQMEDFIDELQEKQLPFEFTDNDFMSALDTKDPKQIYKANGREAEISDLLDNIRDYQTNALVEKLDFYIAKFSKRFRGHTFRRDDGYNEDDFDPFTDFIFFDELSLRCVSPKNFLNTFRQNQIDFDEFKIMISELKSEVEEDFLKLYNENKSRHI